MIVIAFENQSYASVLGAGAPASEFTKLAGECHASITGDCLPGPACQSGAANIFSQVGGSEWRSFGQSMPSTCAKANSGDYVPRHLPALYTRIPAATCAADVVPLPATFGATKRKFVWIAPDRVHDMETGTPAQASAWLQSFLEGPAGILTHAPYTAGHTAVFIWFDTGANGDTVSTPLPFIVISPSTPHTHSSVALERLQRAAGMGADGGRPVCEQRLHRGPNGRGLPSVGRACVRRWPRAGAAPPPRSR